MDHEKARCISHRQALEWATGYCLKHGLKASKNHLIRLFKERATNSQGKTALRWFSCAEVKAGGKIGYAVVETPQLGEQLERALRKNPPGIQGRFYDVDIEDVMHPEEED
jgi:hypothetical protein